MQKLILNFKKLDKDTCKIMRYGLLFSKLICLLAIIILVTYIFSGINLLYHLGILIMKSSFTFSAEFIICGIIVDSLRKHII